MNGGFQPIVYPVSQPIGYPVSQPLAYPDLQPIAYPGPGAYSYPSGYPAGASAPPLVPSGSVLPGAPGTLPALLQEESYVENILRMNLGKKATVYATYENNSEWNAKTFTGILEAAGRDHIILSDPETGRRVLLLMVNVDYITFDQELNYTLPFGLSAVGSGGR